MREKRECSRKIWVKSLFTFPLIDYFHTLPCCSSNPNNSRELEDVVVGKRVLWKFNQKNSHILPLLLDYISTFWYPLSIFAILLRWVRMLDGPMWRAHESSRGIIFLIFRRFQQQKKMLFLIDFREGVWVYVEIFSRLGFFFPSRLLHIARKIDWVASELQISDHRSTARNHLKINYRTFFTPPHRSSVVMCRCRQQNIVRL